MLELLQMTVVSLVAFLLVLTLVVTIHELGHFWVAKACGVAIDRFSIGFGRAIFSRTDRSGVEWRVGWLPLGGYVMFAGDSNASSVPDADDLADLKNKVSQTEGVEALKRYFHFKPIWQRAAVTVAGPMANFLLAIILFAAISMSIGIPTALPKVGGVMPGSAAEAAGFKTGDRILSANGQRIETFVDLSEIVAVRGGAPIDFLVNRESQEIRLTATPKWVEIDTISGKQQVGRLGLEASAAKADAIFLKTPPSRALLEGVKDTWKTLHTTVYVLGRMIRGEISADQLHGPIGIAKLSGEVARASQGEGVGLAETVLLGVRNLAALAAVLSVGVGFMNLLPIPVLDGGHLLFYAYEAIARRPLAAKVQAVGYRVGLALVLCLMLFATWNDLQQLHVFKFLGGLFS